MLAYPHVIECFAQWLGGQGPIVCKLPVNACQDIGAKFHVVSPALAYSWGTQNSALRVGLAPHPSDGRSHCEPSHFFHFLTSGQIFKKVFRIVDFHVLKISALFWSD